MHFWREVKDGSNSFARISEHKETDTAVVFVHGFIGDPIGTWGDLHWRIDDTSHAASFEKADLYFYGYPSTRFPVKVAAEHFVTFLARVFPTPESGLLSLNPRTKKLLNQWKIPDCPRENVGTYKKLVLVGHSLGGVLIRQALPQALEKKYATSPTPDQLKGASVVLFAPAQGGFRLEEELAAAFAAMGLSLVRIWWAAKRAPVYKDLTKNPVILSSIRTGTERLAASGSSFKDANCLRAHTVWGANEHVVYIADYDELDTWRSPYPPDINHVTVCKPTAAFDVPLTWVADGIKRAE